MRLFLSLGKMKAPNWTSTALLGAMKAEFELFLHKILSNKAKFGKLCDDFQD